MGIFDIFKKIEVKSHNLNINKGHTIAEKIDFNFDAMNSAKEQFIAFDVETTGLSPENDRIVELGAVLFVNGRIESSFSTLVNPGVTMPASATKVNHITNDMIKKAPNEDEAYKKLLNYLGRAASGQIIMCAHNARFDFDFLSNTLSRLNYSASFKYIDTLSLSRRYVKGLENYKQETLEKHFGLVNNSSHRAESDAENCGFILCRILNLAMNNPLNNKRNDSDVYTHIIMPDNNEMEVCAYIQSMIKAGGNDTSWLGFRKNSGGYVELSCLYSFLKFKFAKKGKYIILKKEAITTNSTLPHESCSATEGGTEYVRIYFSDPRDLEQFSDIIRKEYNGIYKSLQEYICQGTYQYREAEKWVRSLSTLSDSDMEIILSSIDGKKYDSVDNVKIEPIITRDMVEVNPINNRCPLSQIKNLGNWEKGFDAGYKYYEKAEIARKDGNLEEAIAMYDKARYNGYDAPALYDGYAMVYHKLKDYDNEIEIIEEFFSRKTYGNEGKLGAKRLSAIKALYLKQEAERIAFRKKLEKEKKKLEKEGNKKVAENKQRGRAICQLDDNGNIIAEYNSLSQAIEAVGVSSKSIRDAANGVQKHAGGYCWKYKDQM